MRVVVSEFVTLDGVMEDPGGAEGFEHGGWALRFPGEEAGKFKLAELLASEALLFGRVTYQGFAEAWHSRSDDAGFAEKMNTMPKFVVSTNVETLGWQNSTLIKGDVVVEEVSRLKQKGGRDLLVEGSGELVRTLMQNALVDEYRLLVHPIVLGAGKRLFKEAGATEVLELVESKALGAGTVLLTYRPAGEARAG